LFIAGPFGGNGAHRRVSKEHAVPIARAEAVFMRHGAEKGVPGGAVTVYDISNK
jgi:hypothetical protein